MLDIMDDRFLLDEDGIFCLMLGFIDVYNCVGFLLREREGSMIYYCNML